MLDYNSILQAVLIMHEIINTNYITLEFKEELLKSLKEKTSNENLSILVECVTKV